MHFLTKHFKRPPLAQVNAETLEDAHYQLALNLAAAEYHAAMIGMYQERIARLDPPARIVLHNHKHTGTAP